MTKTTIYQRNERRTAEIWDRIEALACVTRKDGAIEVDGRRVYDVEIANWSGGRTVPRIWCEAGKRGTAAHRIRVCDSPEQAAEWLHGV